MSPDKAGPLAQTFFWSTVFLGSFFAGIRLMAGNWSPNRPPPAGGRYQARARAARVLARDGYICYICGQNGANQADHVIPLFENGPDTEENMAAVHKTPCHQKKSHAESMRARKTTKRPVQKHPGLR